MAQRIRLRRGTAAEWTAANPTLVAGEPGVELDTGLLKIGTGFIAWNSLPYAYPAQGQTGPQGATGAQGATGESARREARSDWQSPYSYIGIAADGSAESASVWKITRITVTGTTVTTAVASPIRWTDRYTATYT